MRALESTWESAKESAEIGLYTKKIDTYALSIMAAEISVPLIAVNDKSDGVHNSFSRPTDLNPYPTKTRFRSLTPGALAKTPHSFLILVSILPALGAVVLC